MNGSQKLLAALMVLVPVMGFAPSPSSAVSGSFTLTHVNPVVARGMNANGFSIFISTASGSNKNTDGGKYLSGARVLNVDTASMVNGNGTHSGNATFTEGTSKVVKQFTGKTTTKMVNGKPESTFKGTWKVLSGTGKYAGLTGSGTYAGRFETATKYSVEWKGSTSM
jgi:hypothetical protein